MNAPHHLHVVDDLDFGGTQTQLLSTTIEHVGRGTEVHVASFRWPRGIAQQLRAAGAEVHYIGRRFWVDPLAMIRLARLAGKLRPVEVRSWDLPSARIWRHARHGNRSRWIHTVRRTVRWVDEQAFHEADEIVVPAEVIATSLVATGVTREKIRIVPNRAAPGIQPADRDEARARLGLTAEGPLIVLATRMRGNATRVKEAIWAADLVRVLHPRLQLYVVGDGPCRAPCERFANQATVPGTVRFLGYRDDWPDWLAASDVVWCPTDSPECATPLVEAIEANKPWVAASTARSEPQPNGQEPTGHCVVWNDRAGWARATDQLLDTARWNSNSE